MFALLAKEIIGGAIGFFKDRASLKQAKLEGQIAITKQAATDVAQWEMLHAKASATSWKDEYVLILLSIPTIMAFIPYLNEYALMGFHSLHELPEWYRYTFVTVCLASYGIKMKDVFFNNK
jgi:hypothetical protein